MNWRVLEGDVLDRLADLEDGCVQTCVTSPPYWGLRDYGTTEWAGGDPDHEHDRIGARGGRGGSGTLDKRSEGAMPSTVPVPVCSCGARRIDRQIGLEATPDEYVARLVGMFREVRRVLRDDGTVWLNLGDSYAGGAAASGGIQRLGPNGDLDNQRNDVALRKMGFGLKPKDLCGIPWRVAFALQQDGWWLRSDIVWSKPNPMPESVTDRPTRSHEYVFLLTKNARYFYDADAIREDATVPPGTSQHNGIRHAPGPEAGRNKRSVWHVATQPFPGAHFAVFPPKLIEPCVLAGCPPKCCGECGAPWERVVERERRLRGSGTLGTGQYSRASSALHGSRDANFSTVGAETHVVTVGWRAMCAHDDDSGSSVVLDPFCGSGTTGVVALRHNRSFVGIELSPEYAEMARDRIRDDAPLLNTGLEVGA